MTSTGNKKNLSSGSAIKHLPTSSVTGSSSPTSGDKIASPASSQNLNPTSGTEKYKLLTRSNRSSSEDQLCKILNEYASIFACRDTDIGRLVVAQHHIRTRDSAPISLCPYRHSIVDNDEIRRQVADLKTKRLIRDSLSPWAFLVTLASKKDGTSRLCIDYRRLSDITVDEPQRLPRINDVIDRLGGCRYFSTLDVVWGYWHVEVDAASVEKRAFVTIDGHYDYLPFGLKDAPATFQRIIQLVLGDLLFRGVMAYVDDIIIFSATFDEHIQLLKAVFDRLKNANIKLRFSKYSFAREEVEYLGHIISNNNVRPSPAKT